MSHYQGQPGDFNCDFPGCDDDYNSDIDHFVAAIKGETIMVFCAKHCQQLSLSGVRLRSVEEIERIIRLNREMQNDADLMTIEQEFIRELKQENY